MLLCIKNWNAARNVFCTRLFYNEDTNEWYSGCTVCYRDAVITTDGFVNMPWNASVTVLWPLFDQVYLHAASTHPTRIPEPAYWLVSYSWWNQELHLQLWSGCGTNEVAVDCLLNDTQLLVSMSLAILRLKLGACPKVRAPGNNHSCRNGLAIKLWMEPMNTNGSSSLCSKVTGSDIILWDYRPADDRLGIIGIAGLGSVRRSSSVIPWDKDEAIYLEWKEDKGRKGGDRKLSFPCSWLGSPTVRPAAIILVLIISRRSVPYISHREFVFPPLSTVLLPSPDLPIQIQMSYVFVHSACMQARETFLVRKVNTQFPDVIFIFISTPPLFLPPIC